MAAGNECPDMVMGGDENVRADSGRTVFSPQELSNRAETQANAAVKASDFFILCTSSTFIIAAFRAVESCVRRSFR